MQYHIVLLASLAAAFSGLGPARPQTQAEVAAPQLQRQQQREKAFGDKAEEQRPDVRLQADTGPAAESYPLDEKPCFPIRRVLTAPQDPATSRLALLQVPGAPLCLRVLATSSTCGTSSRR